MNVKNTPELMLSKREQATLREVFAAYPDVCQVRVFGSRALGTAHAGSDLDLALFDPGLSPRRLRQLRADLEDSDLPFFVDLVYVPALKHAGLRAHIERVGQELFCYKAD